MGEKDFYVLCYHGERIPIRITVLRAEEGHGDMNIRSCDGREWSVRGGVILLNGTPVDPDEVNIQRPGPQEDSILSSLVDMEEMGFYSLDYPIPEELPGIETTEAEAPAASETPAPEPAGTELNGGEHFPPVTDNEKGGPTMDFGNLRVLCYGEEYIPVRVTILRGEGVHMDADIISCDGREWSVRDGTFFLNGARLRVGEAFLQVSNPNGLDYPIPEDRSERMESSGDQVPPVSPKYELIPADAIYPGMFRVRALRDIPRYKVHAGDEGGVIAGEGNLSQEGDCWVERGAMVWNGAFVT